MGNRKRNRNRSSPSQTSVSKKHKPIRFPKTDFSDNISESEGEHTDYFEALESEGELDSVPPPTLENILENNMTKFSQADLRELSSQLAPLLIKDLKAQLRDDILFELKGEISTIVQKETQNLQDEIISLKAQVSNLKSDLKSAKMEQDELAQYGRRMNLDISGIPGDTGSYDEDVEAKILEEAKRLKIKLCSSDIDKCHRRGKVIDNVNRKVIVTFTNSKARQRLYEARKEMSDGIFVQENLTPYRESLAFHARQLKRDILVTKTWVAGCRIFVQLPGETKGRMITDMEAIQEIRNKG